MLALRSRLSLGPVALALGASVLAAAPTTAAPTPTPGTEEAVSASALGTVTVERDESTGRVTFVTVDGKDADLAADASTAPRPRSARSASASAPADAWLESHAGLFGLSRDDLLLTNEIADEIGHTFTYAQTHRGVPVWGSALKANVDADGDLVSVNGRVVPGLTLDVTSQHDATWATKIAVDAVRADPPTTHDDAPVDVTGLTGVASLVVYEVGSPLGQTGSVHLAWQVEVSGGAGLREHVVVEDNKGTLLNRFSEVHSLSRELDTYTGPGPTADMDDDEYTAVWREGDDLSALTPQRRDLLATSEESYHFFRHAFGFDSWDGAGAPMKVRDNRLTGCPNASWHGSYVSVCPGLGVDDVMAHEWGHAYTQSTSGLVYQYQAGALNESYSDVWGETIDLINAREDEGTTHPLRTGDSCLVTANGPDSYLRVVSPRSLAGTCTTFDTATGAASLGAQRPVELVVARNTGSPSSTNACTPLTNAAAAAGRWVYADRGDCDFSVKADHAVAAGASGLVLGNNVSGGFGASLTTSIPVVLVSQADGARLKSLPASAVAKVVVGEADKTEDRWLLGEKSSMGPLRDMWNPQCFGAPAAVTDAQYWCDSDDHGGVHINSGVPNRAFTLFADGGTFRGHRVTGVGLDRAAHVWWRTGAAHLTPLSGFPDFAQGLARACDSLVGEPLRTLSLSADAPATSVTPLTAADCAALDTVIESTQLDTTGQSRCDYTTRLSTADPAMPCGPGTTRTVGLEEDFESPTGWSTDLEKPTGSFRTHWGLMSPGDRSSGAAFAEAPNVTCLTPDQPTFTGRTGLTSPTVTVGENATSTILRFRHRFALESDFDGGNVKVSVNGRPFTQLPVTNTHWIINAPTQVVAAYPGFPAGDNPLVGQGAWSGHNFPTDNPWVTSAVNLSAAGVQPGDTVQVRFDLGTDQCGGVWGWAVDDVSISWCEPTSAVASTAPRVTPASGAALENVDAPELRADPEVVTPEATTPETTTETPDPSPEATQPTATGTTVRAPARIVRGKAFTLTARVTRADRGRVRFVVAGRVVGTAQVVNGVARLRVRPAVSRTLPLGKRRVAATYVGTKRWAASTGRTALRLRR